MRVLEKGHVEAPELVGRDLGADHSEEGMGPVDGAIVEPLTHVVGEDFAVAKPRKVGGGNPLPPTVHR